MADPASRAESHVLDAHVDTVETVLRCADAVADDWTDDATTDRSAVAGPLRARLEAAGAWTRLPEVLAGAVDAAGYSLRATPVADPPYVAVTSRGPVLRATVADGRLVVLLQAFDIERRADGSGATGPRYVRGPTTPEAAVRARFK